MQLPKVTVIIPVRNEEQHIAGCLYPLIRGTYPQELLEILVVDGGSTDETRAIAEAIATESPNIKVLDNPRRNAAAGMNIGITTSSGDYIVRMDAHAFYHKNYIEQLITYALALNADNVGGVLRTLPGAETQQARAVAVILSHQFGVGPSTFRTGVKQSRFMQFIRRLTHRRSDTSR